MKPVLNFLYRFLSVEQSTDWLEETLLLEVSASIAFNFAVKPSINLVCFAMQA
jgi:hypothetical protein